MTAYTCRYCRTQSEIDETTLSCASCGAPVDVTTVVSDSGWQEQPPIADMARIQFGQSYLQVEGTQVPVADFDLRGPEWIFFSHHTLLWTEPTVSLQSMPMAGGWNRVRSGMPLVMVQAGATGHIALSEDAPGEIVAIPIPAGRSMVVREHRFLAATGEVGYTWTPSNVWYATQNGDDREYHYPLGLNLDIFGANDRPGLLLLHSPGNTFIRDLAPGESISVQPTALLYADVSVGINLHLEYPATSGLSWGRKFSYRQIWVRLSGPGRVAVQSVFERPEASEPIVQHSPATIQRW